MINDPLVRSLEYVSQAYLIHLVSMNRRPVFRHENGEIGVTLYALGAFIDGYLAERYAPAQRATRYLSLIDFDGMSATRPNLLADWGPVAMLKPRGIRYINAMLKRYGEMIQELGGEEKATQWLEERNK